MSPNFEYIAVVLDDYCDMQTSGIIPTANRYPVADVQEQVALLGQLEPAGNAVLANRIAELEREKAGLVAERDAFAIRLEDSEEQYSELHNKNSALAAQVEVLQRNLSRAIAAFHLYELSVDDYPTMQHNEMMRSLENAASATPQQHLAELRAEAGRAGFVAGYEFCLSTLPSPYCNLIAVNYKGMAERYADSIIKDEVK